MIGQELGVLTLTLLAGCAPLPAPGIVHSPYFMTADLRWDGTANDTVKVLPVQGDIAANILWTIAGTTDQRFAHVSDSAVGLVGTRYIKLDSVPVTLIGYEYTSGGLRCLGEIAVDTNGIEVGH